MGDSSYSIDNVGFSLSNVEEWWHIWWLVVKGNSLGSNWSKTTCTTGSKAFNGELIYKSIILLINFSFFIFWFLWKNIWDCVVTANSKYLGEKSKIIKLDLDFHTSELTKLEKSQLLSWMLSKDVVLAVHY